jgi:hypothetical protein
MSGLSLYNQQFPRLLQPNIIPKGREISGKENLQGDYKIWMGTRFPQAAFMAGTISQQQRRSCRWQVCRRDIAFIPIPTTSLRRDGSRLPNPPIKMTEAAEVGKTGQMRKP